MRPLIRSAHVLDPIAEFDKVLVSSRARVLSSNKNANEPDFCAGIVTNKTIDDLNMVAEKCFDNTENTVKFYGGFIHKTPLAKYEAKSMTGNADRRCELSDLLIITVRADVNMVAGGSSFPKKGKVTVEKRACLIQAKLSDVPTGSRVCDFDLLGPMLPSALPLKGSEQAQLYLYNQWPDFTLSGDPTRSYNLKKVTPGTQSVCKYGHVLTTKDEAIIPRPWTTPHMHVWQYAQARPNERSSGTLGDLILGMAELIDGAGASYSPRNMQPNSSDWPDLLDELTRRCRLSRWKGTRDANPASLDVRSWLSLFSPAFTYQATNESPGSMNSDFIPDLMTHFAKRHSNRRSLHMKKANGGKSMPVLFVLVGSRKCADDADVGPVDDNLLYKARLQLRGEKKY